jgi:hypothetical protein
MCRSMLRGFGWREWGLRGAFFAGELDRGFGAKHAPQDDIPTIQC